MKRLFVFFIIAIAVAASLFALPATDARFLNIEITYHLQSDGSWDMEYRHQVRLDTYYAVNRALGETFIVYNPDFQKLEILKAETTMVDGRKVAAPANAFNEVLPFAAHGFSDFANLREMVVTHTGLERGATVDLHYRIHTKAGFLPVFSGREVLSRAFPVDSFKLTLIVPAGQDLRFRRFWEDTITIGEVSDCGADKCYVFAFQDLKPAAHEPLEPVWAEPFIVFSNAADWGQALAMSGDSSQLPTALVEKVEKLKAQNPAWPDLLAAVQKIAAAEVQNCDLRSETVGWQPRPIERVALSNYGTKLEKALLLQALLKKVGIPTEVLTVAVGPAFAPEVPAMQQVGEYWLKASDGFQTAYLDPCHEQDEFLPTRCQMLAAFNIERKVLEYLPAADWDQNGVEISGTVALDPAGASGNLVVTARGIFNRYSDVVENSGKFIEGLLKKFFPVEKAEVKKLLLLSRREIRVEATFSGKWLKEAGAGFFSVDSCRLPGLSENMVLLARRESPILLGVPFKVSLNLDLQPAAGLSLDYAAPEVKLTNEAGKFSRSHILGKDGHIRFVETCGIEKMALVPEQYPLLRELLQTYFTPDFWLVFKKSK